MFPRTSKLQVLNIVKKWLCAFQGILRRFSKVFSEYLLRDVSSISPYSVQMRENADQNNSEYGHFLRNVFLQNTPY